VNAQPWHPLFSPDGKRAYFGNKGAHTVTIIDMESWSVDGVVEGEGLAQPHGSSLSRDGRYLYISNSNKNGHYQSNKGGTVTVIDTQTKKIVKVVEIGANATGVGTNAW
jgi:DNA-binding beta-propeller fold protein YncE